MLECHSRDQRRTLDAKFPALSSFTPRMHEEAADEGQETSLKLRGAGLEDEPRPLSGSRQTEESGEDELSRLDVDLDAKSRRHNLTSCNVRTILHEVITHERVVAMMKAAIRDTQDMPMFEPKMTRSRLKRAIQQGQCLDWSLSAEQSSLPPQFVDIHLDADEDSSDEEYCPEDDDDDDTAEESFLSDGDIVSPPKVQHCDCRSQGDSRAAVLDLTDAAAGPSFLERLNAVEEELDCGPAYTSFSSHRTDEDEEKDEASSSLAFRTRSKLRLVNVPLEQLEAELLAPDITADMYEQNPARKEEDRHWTRWLHGLVTPDNGEEVDDDDDPEYNFLDDLDEPDLEDYRTDRAVQITKREVNELLEELFDRLQDQEPADDEEEEEEEHPAEGEEQEAGPKFNVPQALCFKPPLAGMLTERRRAVRQQFQAVQHRRALQDTTNHPADKTAVPPAPPHATWLLHGPLCPTLQLDCAHKLQLQQQIQQHVQLLTEVHLLSCGIGGLEHEASVTKHFLVGQVHNRNAADQQTNNQMNKPVLQEELQCFAMRQEQLFCVSSFRACNLQGALDLLQESERRLDLPPPPPRVSRRWLPVMSSSTNSHAFPVLPSDTAWLLATRPVFLYPELLPVCSLDPSHHTRPHRSLFTVGEDGLIVLGLKHFEGAIQPVQLISSYMVCKSAWHLTKHIREMSGSRAPRENILKMFLAQQLVTPLPLACARVQPEDQRPPVERDPSIMPIWLKNSQEIIWKTQVNTSAPCYPLFHPRGCNLRLHPSRLKRSLRQPGPSQRRLFTLAHNASLHPICPAERKADFLRSSRPEVSATSPAVPRSVAPLQPSYILLQRDATLQLPPTAESQPKPVPALKGPIASHAHRPEEGPNTYYENTSLCQQAGRHWTNAEEKGQGEEDDQARGKEAQEERVRQAEGKEGQGEEEEQAGRKEGQGEEEEQAGRKEGQGEEEEQAEGQGEEEEHRGGKEGQGEEEEQEEEGQGEEEEHGGKEGQEEEEEQEEGQGEEEEQAGGEEGQGEEEEQAEEGQGEEEERGGEEEEEPGDGEKDEDQERQEEEEDEDFDELTQDEDEEEALSSASEESLLSIPELQETMKQLAWLASKRRLGADAESEEDHSPTSPGSQEEEEEEEEAPKGDEPSRKTTTTTEDDDGANACEEETPRTGRRGGGIRGRGQQSRPLRGARRARQERPSKDERKVSLLYDENMLENDPQRHSKDVAFAHSYLNRVREALHDVPEKMEEFVSLLNDLERLEGQEVVRVFRKLRCILGNRTELTQDFAAFLHPEQALECGLFQEQQAFERSRRFLRQLEITFGDNPSHYNKIIKALQPGPHLTPASINELKAQMAILLKGHPHLQAEFWVFFDELRPPPARPGQFEEAHWPEEGGIRSEVGEGGGYLTGGVANGAFEEVTLPDEDEHKMDTAMNRRLRKLRSRSADKGSDWLCLCQDSKSRTHRRRGCPRCHGNKGSGGVSRAMKSLDPLYAQIGSASEDKDGDVKVADFACPVAPSWERSFPLAADEGDKMSPPPKRKREEELHPPPIPPCAAPAPSDLPVCAKNISLTPSGEKVILWTRDADRVILTTCRQEGANQNTFQGISGLLGNKTPAEVSRRFRDLMRLFQSAARQAGSEDEAPPSELDTNEELD
ncbi:GON-4-like protein isoform X2 [Phycodurus eques]|uniref:GON-4-like protein isoform X2 n=1 Tax=Phycodurus eques TaxID=693459 RepID=UPI002ACD9C91|nr:GON-4-like protein isoform X2 [Phycodurus eques]